MMIISVAIPIVMFDVLDNDAGIDASTFITFDEDFGELAAENITEQAQELGYESHNAFMNLGTMSIVFLLYVF